MGKHWEVLNHLVLRCCEVDPNCGIMLQGSVARGQERSDSDVDITVLLKDIDPVPYNEIIRRDNHFGMIRIHLETWGINVDVNWLFSYELALTVRERGAAAWYMFAQGTAVHDPLGIAKHAQRTIQHWFTDHPMIRSEWERQQEAVEKWKRDPKYALPFDSQPAFCAYLNTLLSP